MAHETIIKVDNIYKSYQSPGSLEKTEVLKGVSLEIQSRDFVIIYGASGSGKSTLLHHIVGLESPTKGEIHVRGTNLTKLDGEERAIFRAQKFGMVYQSFYWSKSLTVWENVALPLYLTGEDSRKAKSKAMKALEEIDMEKYAFKNPMQLSGGEQQRVSLARALVNNPWILIADEPTGNLDTHNADQIIQIFQELNIHHKRTIIMVTHNLAYLMMATKTVCMKDGMIVSSGTDGVKAQIKEELKGIL